MCGIYKVGKRCEICKRIKVIYINEELCNDCKDYINILNIITKEK